MEARQRASAWRTFGGVSCGTPRYANLLNMGRLGEVQQMLLVAVDANVFEEIEDAALGGNGLAAWPRLLDSAATQGVPRWTASSTSTPVQAVF